MGPKMVQHWETQRACAMAHHWELQMEGSWDWHLEWQKEVLMDLHWAPVMQWGFEMASHWVGDSLLGEHLGSHLALSLDL